MNCFIKLTKLKQMSYNFVNLTNYLRIHVLLHNAKLKYLEHCAIKIYFGDNVKNWLNNKKIIIKEWTKMHKIAYTSVCGYCTLMSLRVYKYVWIHIQITNKLFFLFYFLNQNLEIKRRYICNNEYQLRKIKLYDPLKNFNNSNRICIILLWAIFLVSSEWVHNILNKI